MRNAIGYVELAEAASGKIGRPVNFDYVWGDALAELDRRRPDARIVNLETAVTRSGDPAPGKGIHYRMNPANVAVLTSAGLDCCVLANNHVMDYGEEGLIATVESVAASGIATAGAGRDAAQASRPAEIVISEGRRVLVFAFAMETSGVPPAWAATRERPGVNLLPDLSPRTVNRVAGEIEAHRRSGDLIVVSLHWGGNWGFDVPAEERRFAQALTDTAGADLIHGHSSHHVKGLEIIDGKLVIHGCGDFINDYEGIHGYERYRGDIAVMYFPELDSAGRLLRLAMVPLRRRRLRLERAGAGDTDWLCRTMTLAGREFGTQVAVQPDGCLLLHRG